MTMPKKLCIILALAFVGTATVLVFFPHVVRADLMSEIERQNHAFARPDAAGYGTPTDVRIVVAQIIKVFLSLVGTLIILYTIYGGFLVMTSNGEEDKISKGKKIIGYGVLGAGIILSAYAIAAFTFYLLFKGQQNPFADYFFFGVEPDRTDYYNPDPAEGSTVPGHFNLFQ